MKFMVNVNPGGAIFVKGLEGTRVILNLAGTRTALTADQRESVAQNYHAELDELATMRDVDDCLLMLAGDSDPGPFLERLRREQFERRHRVRREGNVVRVEFGRAR